MDITQILLSFVGGFFAGILNTFAGFGSIITFAIYMDVLGLPGHIANATNRVNVLASSSVSTITFIRNDKLNISKSKWIFITVFLGAVVGILMATQLDNEGFEKAFNYLLIPILVLLLINPKRFIQAQIDDIPTTKWVLIPLFFVFGIYAGFIQVGFGVVFLILMVMMAKYDLVHSNAIKVYIIAAYTLIAIIIFHYQGLIEWKSGIMLAVGQAIGGYVAARNASRMEGANKWAYIILVLIVTTVIIKNFRLWTYFF